MKDEGKIKEQTLTLKPAYMYVPRKIDGELWDSFMTWWADSSKRAGWISLESDRGRGNTYLIEHFRHRIEEHPGLGRDARVIFVDADENEINEDLPQELPPIAGTVFNLHGKSSLPWSRHLKHWFAWQRLARFAVMFLGLILLSIIIAIIHEFGWLLHTSSAEFSDKLVQSA
jgi:hypothetical protein